MEEKEDKGDLKKFITSSLESMTKNIIQGFGLLVGQLGSKSTPRSSSSTPHDEGKTNGETNFPKTRPHNRPHDFKN